MRLARNETNIAYRTADQLRWEQMDFVVGFRVVLSNNHTCLDNKGKPQPFVDICDDLSAPNPQSKGYSENSNKGKYPKDFVFKGWHPQCRCFTIPILATDEEIEEVEQRMLDGDLDAKVEHSQNEVTEPNDDFKKWAKDNAERIQQAEQRGTLPYFVRDNKAMIDRYSNKLSIVERAKIRHNARTQEQIDDIQKKWDERTKKHILIKNTANNIIKVAQDYGEVDYSSLQLAIDAGNIADIQTLTKSVARNISAIKKQEKSISSLIPNAHSLHRSYSMNMLQQSYKELDKVMKTWLSKYNYSSLDNAPLLHLKNKLDFELTSPSIAYSHKDIINKALKDKIRIINQKIEWDELVSKATSLKSFKTKSPIFKNCLTKIEKAIQSNNFKALQKSIADAEIQQQKLVVRQLKRSGNSALNVEYKGTATGKDITANVDVNTLTTTDSFYGEKRYTNNIARMQGFDAPAKLVSEHEFEALEKACGEVFYRTVNATTFKGKNMSSYEFASQLYRADLLELNGPGGRAYGDGMYVATASWDGMKNVLLSKQNKQYAYDSSRCYGNENATIFEMTFVRMPKIIKQSDLKIMWNKLSKKQQELFGKHDNTYACALGYDAMYCDGPNYMVIWNRSIIAVKKQ